MRFLANFDEAEMEPRHHSGKPVPLQRQDFPFPEHLDLEPLIIVLAKLVDWNAIDQVVH